MPPKESKTAKVPGPREAIASQVSIQRGKAAATIADPAVKRAFISREGDAEAAIRGRPGLAVDYGKLEQEARMQLNKSDIKKNKNGLGYIGADSRTSRDVADTSTSWSVGAVVAPDRIINESKELADLAQVYSECEYAASLWQDAGNSASPLSNQHNKSWGGGADRIDEGAIGRADQVETIDFAPASTGSGAYGDELQRSYHIDPPLGDNTALSGLSPGPSVLSRGGTPGSSAGFVNQNQAARSSAGGGLQAMPSLDAGNVGGPQDAGGIETGARGTL